MIASRRLAPLLLLLAGLAALAACSSSLRSRPRAGTSVAISFWTPPTAIRPHLVGRDHHVGRDFEDHKLYAYRMSDRSRDSGRDFTMDTANGSPVGIWSDGTTMWASDFAAGKLYAYRMSDRSRDADNDFDTLQTPATSCPRASGRTGPPCGCGHRP